MAVDGVAPRAKMNQQRSRRFRSAKEAEENEKKAREKGEALPKEGKFDSNVITPGTGFMVRLDKQLRYFINNKITHDDAWRGIKVFLSGHETPGEGEHKIMEYIRHQRTLPEHDPRTRHCLYGLDADLIMLGLATHEPNFSLLREEIQFTKSKDKMMRDYIHHEFKNLRSSLASRKEAGEIQIEYDLERLIDDWVLMGFLVGNDFVPHLPNMHIKQDHLPVLYRCYTKVVPKLGKYLTERGSIDLDVLEEFFFELAENEREQFENSQADDKYLAGKRSMMKESHGSGATAHGPRIQKKLDELEALALEQEEEGLFEGDTTQGDLVPIDAREIGTDFGIWDDVTKQEFVDYRNSYYHAKFNKRLTKDFQFTMKNEYIRALQWIMHYYYNGVQSWGWYFPFHYSPFISDLVNLKECNLKYDYGKPFLPFEQLLAVLPASSGKVALPEVFHSLMDSPSSPIIDFYPTEFETDLNGKMQDWEAVVLIPFIDENRLYEAMKPALAKLSPFDKCRNIHSPCNVFEYDPKIEPYHYPSPIPESFPHLEACRSKSYEVPTHEGIWKLNLEAVRYGLLKPSMELLRPGFPTLFHIEHYAELERNGVKIFNMASRGENMMLYIGKHLPDSDWCKNIPKTMQDMCKKWLGKNVAVGWPHCYSAKVVEVSSVKHRAYFKNTDERKNVVGISDNNKFGFEQQLGIVEDALKERWGISLGETDYLIHAKPLIGRKVVYSGSKPKVEKVFGDVQVYPLQTCVRELTTEEPYKKIHDVGGLFTADKRVFCLSPKFYGCSALVTGINEDGLVSVEVTQHEHIDVEVARQSATPEGELKWFPGWRAAQATGISSYMVSRITGHFYVDMPGEKNQRRNIGLSLRSNKGKGMEAPGFTMKKEEEDNRIEWLYSSALIDCLNKYIDEYREVFDILHDKFDAGDGRNNSSVEITASDIFPDSENVNKNIDELAKFIKTLECSQSPTVECGIERLSKTEIDALVKLVDHAKANETKVVLKKNFSPKLLYAHVDGVGRTDPDGKTKFTLWDRVVNCRGDTAVPLGWQGTVIGTIPEKAATTGVGSSIQSPMCNILWDKPFMGGSNLNGMCPPRRGYRLPEFCLLNLNKKRQAQNREQKTRKGTEKKKVQIHKRESGDGFSTMPADFMSKLKQIVPNARMESGQKQAVLKPEPIKPAPHVDPSIISSQQMPPTNVFQNQQVRMPINPLVSPQGVMHHQKTIPPQVMNQPRGPAMVPTQIMANLNSRQMMGMNKSANKNGNKRPDRQVYNPGNRSQASSKIAENALKSVLKIGRSSGSPFESPAASNNGSRNSTPTANVEANGSETNRPREVKENVERLPIGPPDNTTKGFKKAFIRSPRSETHGAENIDDQTAKEETKRGYWEAGEPLPEMIQQYIALKQREARERAGVVGEPEAPAQEERKITEEANEVDAQAVPNDGDEANQDTSSTGTASEELKDIMRGATDDQDDEWSSSGSEEVVKPQPRSPASRKAHEDSFCPPWMPLPTEEERQRNQKLVQEDPQAAVDYLMELVKKSDKLGLEWKQKEEAKKRLESASQPLASTSEKDLLNGKGLDGFDKFSEADLKIATEEEGNSSTKKGQKKSAPRRKMAANFGGMKK
ncbi:Oidioi.mRNA.OKI2018_I69.PAR.g11207.t1.cds [Oikopleura dioica]|uniref:5'-3' exoribonuclease 1 n=1 Tax=Oikopleura dioica TaxID=34765 RepID=A0ABN7S0H5_OIKDI|nr:Oidioi.mRNA.OKI2018_I69.PAR.g11207.t1.cds [Oikopleura dioica]